MAEPSRVSADRDTNSTLPPIPTRTPLLAALVGIAAMGPLGFSNGAEGSPQVNQPITSWSHYQSVYGGFSATAYDLPMAAKSFFDEGGQLLFVSRVVHTTVAGDLTTKTSTSAFMTLSTGVNVASPGTALGAGVAPFSITSGQHLDISIDAFGTVVLTFTAAAAVRDSADGTFNLANNDHLTFSVTSTNGVKAIDVVFVTGAFVDITAATATEVKNVVLAALAAQNAAAIASVSGLKVRLTTNLLGTTASIGTFGGAAAAKLGFSGTGSGSGNVGNAALIQVAELKTLVETATSNTCTVTNEAGQPRITSNTTGLSSLVQIIATTTATTFGFDNASHGGGAAGTEDTLRIDARWDGTYAHEYSVRVTAPVSGATGRFDFYVIRTATGITVESWRDASMNPADPSYFLTLMNQGYAGQVKSTLFKAVDLESTYASPGNLPAVGTFGPFTGGADGTAGLVDLDYLGAVAGNGNATGLRVFKTVPRIDGVAIPGRSTAASQSGLVTWCEIDREGHTFAVLGGAAGWKYADVRQHVTQTAGLKETSEVASYYYGRLIFPNPSTALYGSATTIVGPSEGAILGLFSRVDTSQDAGVFKHPSNALGQLRSALGVDTTDPDDPAARGLMEGDLINSLRSKGGRVFIDGARTLKSTGPFPTVGESRGVMFIQNEIIERYELLRNANIDSKLYGQLTNASTLFLRKLSDAGAFYYGNYEQDFYVDYGAALNTAAVVEAREVIGVLGVSTSPPAEKIRNHIVPFRALAAAFANQLAA